MVSIPDWSKLARLTDQQLAEPRNASRYNKQRELDLIKQAEEHGYFLNPSKSFILHKFKQEDPEQIEKDRILGRKRDLDEEVQDVEFIKLPNQHLKTIGEVSRCRNLRICILSNNYITKMDSLMACHHLIKLDLHSNQISMLPGAELWAYLTRLQMLYLHDNPLGKMENIHHIAASPRLNVLTLFDTPLSLRKNYRHHVVNSVWSLKALDKHVISDEEIIEDADFGPQFTAMNPYTKVNVCPLTWEDAGYKDERQVMRDVLEMIHCIMAHTSPVLIIQRYVRGWLTRKTYKLIQDTRIWAAVTIQRFWRNYHGYPHPKDIVPPPPSTSPVPDLAKLDYDTYMKIRRPSSTTVTDREEKKDPSSSPEAKSSSGSAHKRRKSLLINLSKLQQGTLQTLQEEAIAIETILPYQSSFYLQKASKTDMRKSKKKKVPTATLR